LINTAKDIACDKLDIAEENDHSHDKDVDDEAEDNHHHHDNEDNHHHHDNGTNIIVKQKRIRQNY